MNKYVFTKFSNLAKKFKKFTKFCHGPMPLSVACGNPGLHGAPKVGGTAAQPANALLRNPCMLGGPWKKDKIKAQHSKTEKENNRLPSCPYPCLFCYKLPTPGVEPQRHCLTTRVQANSDKGLLRDGIDVWSNMFFIHY